MVEIYTLLVDVNLNKEDFSNLLKFVSKEKRELIHKFHHFEDAQRSLLGDILARYAIIKKLGPSNNRLIFGNNNYGKPILLEPNGIHYNISHSGNWVVCAIDNSPVGIDVEVIKPININIAKRFFSKKEYLELQKQPEEIRLKYFYMIWTLKESYIKAEGKGLSIPLRSFTINIENSNAQINLGNKDCKDYSFYQSTLDNNTLYAICALTNQFNERTDFNITSFLQTITLTLLS